MSFFPIFFFGTEGDIETFGTEGDTEKIEPTGQVIQPSLQKKSTLR